MLQLSMPEVVAATAAEVLVGGGGRVFDVVIDSRQVHQGSLFVCFTGERVDGNAYAATAANWKATVERLPYYTFDAAAEKYYTYRYKVEELSIIYTNCGNLILPIVSMTLGEKMVFYGSAYQLSYNLLFWTHGAARLQDSPRIDWKKVLLNPNIIAIACGIFMLLARISLPGPVDTAIEMLANMVGPISMLVIGMTLAGSSLLRIFTDKRAYLVTFLRLIVLPLLALGVLRVSGFLARFPEYIPVFRISFLAISAPPGSNVAQVAVLYNKEPVRAGIYNLMGMMLCMFTIPLIDYLYMMCFG